MKKSYQIRRTLTALVAAAVLGVCIFVYPEFQQPQPNLPVADTTSDDARAVLDTLAVKGRAPKTGYERSQFGDGWKTTNGCDTRNIILRRDLTDTEINEKCQVVKGVLVDAYTGKTIQFTRSASTSDDVQIDHVVALSDAWQKGAQQLSYERRVELANDPLELIAVDGPANQQKSDGDVATWLPPLKSFRCQYVARQIAIKHNYSLWITSAEKDAMVRVLESCPGQNVPAHSLR